MSKRSTTKWDGNPRNRPSSRHKKRGKTSYSNPGYSALEEKFVDYELLDKVIGGTLAGSECNPTGLGSISANAEGKGESQHDGRKYSITGVHLRGNIFRPLTAGVGTPADDAVVRLAVILDKRCNATEFSAENVFKPLSTVSDVYAMRNLQETGRYAILKDKRIRIPSSQSTVAIGSATTFTTGVVVVPFTIDINFKKPVVVYAKNTLADVTSIVDNNIGVMCLSTTSNLKMSYMSRVRFHA